MGIQFLFFSLFKIAAIIGIFYGLFRMLNQKQLWMKVLGIVLAFGIVQLALSIQIGDTQILNNFDAGLLFQACAMAMVALGLNLIYGFNGQFSLGQWGFYGLGAYAAADITYRWTNGDSSGLLVELIGVILGGLMILGVGRLFRRYRGVPVLSQFTVYLLGSVAAAAVAVFLGNLIAPALNPLLGSSGDGPLATGFALQVVFFLSVICGGVFAAEVSFLIGLPVLTLGSDYFGIATLGFTIVVNVLMNNSDTILPFPEMKGARGMIGIPTLTNWIWAFFFLMVVVIIMRNIIQSSTGRTVISVREDETAARAMGVDVAGTKLLAFVIGSLFAGLGGGVYAHYIGFLSPTTFNFITGFNPLIIVVFGGLGSMSGTIAASFGWIFFLEGMLRVLLGQMGTEAPTWRYVLYPITLLLVMLLRPQGLLGNHEWGFLKSPFVKPRKKLESPPSIPANVNAVKGG
jgi:branched-chain amino acid transport system permease protein